MGVIDNLDVHTNLVPRPNWRRSFDAWGKLIAVAIGGVQRADFPHGFRANCGEYVVSVRVIGKCFETVVCEAAPLIDPAGNGFGELPRFV